MKKLILILSLITTSVPNIVAQTLLVSENFSGLGTENINGTTADTFSSDLTSGGGNSTWRAASNSIIMAGNGTLNLPVSTSGATYLKLGSYINSSKGTSSSKFTLTATITKPTGSGWVTAGFFGASSDTNSLSGNTFIDAALPGFSTAVHRSSDSSNNFMQESNQVQEAIIQQILPEPKPSKSNSILPPKAAIMAPPISGQPATIATQI